jgi:hypothetical protein
VNVGWDLKLLGDAEEVKVRLWHDQRELISVGSNLELVKLGGAVVKSPTPPK